MFFSLQRTARARTIFAVVAAVVRLDPLGGRSYDVRLADITETNATDHGPLLYAHRVPARRTLVAGEEGAHFPVLTCLRCPPLHFRPGHLFQRRQGQAAQPVLSEQTRPLCLTEVAAVCLCDPT